MIKWENVIRRVTGMGMIKENEENKRYTIAVAGTGCVCVCVYMHMLVKGRWGGC